MNHPTLDIIILFLKRLWKNGIDAIDRIKDIEAGVHLSDIEVIPNSARHRSCI